MSSDAGTCHASSPAERSGASCSPNPAQAPTSLVCRPGRLPCPAAGSSTARRSGPRSPIAPTSGSCSPAQTPTPPSTTGSRCSSSILMRPESRSDRSASSTVRCTSTRCSSPTCSYRPRGAAAGRGRLAHRVGDAAPPARRPRRGQRGGVRHDRTDRLPGELRHRDLTDPVVRDELVRLYIAEVCQSLLVTRSTATGRAIDPGPIGSLGKLTNALVARRFADVAWRLVGADSQAWPDRRSASRGTPNQAHSGRPTHCSRCRCPLLAAPTRSNARSSENGCSAWRVSPLSRRDLAYPPWPARAQGLGGDQLVVGAAGRLQRVLTRTRNRFVATVEPSRGSASETWAEVFASEHLCGHVAGESSQPDVVGGDRQDCTPSACRTHRPVPAVAWDQVVGVVGASVPWARAHESTQPRPDSGTMTPEASCHQRIRSSRTRSPCRGTTAVASRRSPIDRANAAAATGSPWTT